MKIKLIILILLVLQQACCTYNTILNPPETKVIKTYHDKTIYYSIIIGSANKEKLLVTKSLNKFCFKELKEISENPGNGLYLKITITHAKDNLVKPGIIWITILSLGIIPTYTTNSDYYLLNYSLYKNRALISQKEYKIIVKSFNWLFSILVKYGPRGDYYRLENLIDHINNDFLNISFEKIL